MRLVAIITIEPLCLTTWTTELTNKNPIDTDMRLKVKPILDEAAEQIRSQKEDVSRLAYVASHHPFYKYNGVWTRELQNLVSSAISYSCQPEFPSRMNASEMNTY